MEEPAARPRPATIVDVAEAAGVSRQTVTRAVHDAPGISAATRERVLAAARALRYRPSRFGRGLVGTTTPVLGLLVADLTNPYYPELASAVGRAAGRAGWQVVLAERVHATEPATFPGPGFYDQVDAVVAFTGAPLAPPGDGLLALPMVEVDPGGAPHGGSVDLDLAPAARAAVAHLRARGVARCAVMDLAPPRGRATLFTRLLTEAGVRAERVVAPTADLAGGAAVVAELAGRGALPDAVVAFNDVAAFGVLRALQLAGVDVPGRVRVVGVDGLGIADFVTPRLTTLALDMDVVARAAVEVVLALRAGDLEASEPAAHRRVAHELVLGEST